MIINPRNLVTPSKSLKLHSHVVKGVSSPARLRIRQLLSRVFIERIKLIHEKHE